MSGRRARREGAWGGLAVAVVGFSLTRSATAASTTNGSTLAFLLGEAPFLIVGLGLSLFGVVLAVNEWGRTHGWTVARWCLLGTVATGVAVAASVVGSELAGVRTNATTTALGLDLLLAGAVGGALTGVQVSRRHDQQRDLAERTTRLTLLNRILRHEVLNGVNVVRGYASLVGVETDGGEHASDPRGVIERSADRIGDAVDEVTALTHPDPLAPVSVAAVVESSVAAVSERHPDAEIRYQRAMVDDVDICATTHVADLFEHLLRNAVEHNPKSNPAVAVTAEVGWRRVSITVADDGPGMPDAQRRVLRDGSLPEYDDPTAGFGVTVVRLLAEESGARVDVGPGIDGDGTGVTLTFRRHQTPDGHDPTAVGGLSTGWVRDAAVASVVAGGVMGLLLDYAAGSLPVIGSLYGVASPFVGWTTHLFHSLVFGVAFAAALATPRFARYRRRLHLASLAGAGYGAGLSLVAAGVVMPLWLRALGVPAPVPNLSSVGFVGHLVWGVTLAGLLVALRRRG
ncbi:ATP-binding protein [Halogeometricum limi]|uniref:histidine kinase n=1 Tax=Halogeometricum limi TaxID=555875 RepID=A0A1I6FU03_9EURY|nr:ATP-binding protein [Halogeometricum limi]SFR33398.1 Signal transduction histidine kinase [Halogeometricum limi]